jgi:zinc transporter, ZIP family
MTTTLLLGLIAGGTILIGLPVGRMQRLSDGTRVFLNAIAIGVLIFLTWDVLSAAWEPIDADLVDKHIGSAIGYGALMLAGVGIGLLGLAWYERWMATRVHSGDVHTARTLALMIAVGIGLHNFAEGLAIGQSAASGEISLAVMLVIGFGLHNATEGFGIVVPLAGDRDESGLVRRPSWSALLLLGLIGGGPTFLGTILGHSFTSEPLSVVFLSLAAGSIVYVIMQLVAVAARARRTDLLALGVLIGMFAGFCTDAIVTAAGV